MPDPVLVKVIPQFEQLLLQHDLTGVIVLGSRTHQQFLLQLCSSWTALKLQEEPDGRTKLHFKCKREDYPTREAWMESMTQSFGTLLGFADTLQHLADQLRALAGDAGKNQGGVSHSTRHEDPPIV